jgi:hypothetical protein
MFYEFDIVLQNNKSYYVRNLRMFFTDKSVCFLHAFPA